MPYFDGTGPRGQGQLTGRGFGSCAGYGRGKFGMGPGAGFGLRRRFSKKETLEMLDEEEKDLLAELEAIKEEKKAFKDAK